MIDDALVPWLLAGVPFLGALVTLALWSSPDHMKLSSIIWTVIGLGVTVGLLGRLRSPPEGFLLLYLLPVAAGVSILGYPTHREHRTSWIMTLVCLGFGVGALTGRGLVAQLFVMALLASIIVLLYRNQAPHWPAPWWGMGAFGLGFLCIGISAVVGPSVPSAILLLAWAILLPVTPLHAGYLTAVTRLPGSLPSFLVLLFPAVGLHGLADIVPTLPASVSSTVSLFALVGALHGSIKALAQFRIQLVLVYGSLSFFSMLWWFGTTTMIAMPRASVLVGAIGLATSGLLLAWQVVCTRYGADVDPQAVSGLSSRMPKYAVLLSLLALAAMGLPPFGVFSGFMGLLLTSPLSSSLGVFVTLIAWLAASWYIMQMVQQLIFGAQKPDLRYIDLSRSEAAALLILVVILLVLGVVPVSFFGPAMAAYTMNVVTEPMIWNR